MKRQAFGWLQQRTSVAHFGQMPHMSTSPGRLLSFCLKFVPLGGITRLNVPSVFGRIVTRGVPSIGHFISRYMAMGAPVGGHEVEEPQVSSNVGCPPVAGEVR